MRQKTEQEELALRYLLGELTAEEQAQVEGKFFSDSEFFEQVMAMEDALIDGYVQGRLSPDERRKFEEIIKSSPDRQREVEFARRLIRDLSRMRAGKAANVARSGGDFIPTRRPLPGLRGVTMLWARYSFVVLLLIAGVAAYLFVSNLKLRDDVRQLQARRYHLEGEQRDLLQRLEDENRSAGAVSVAFSKNVITRGPGSYIDVYIPPGARQLQCRIAFDNTGDYTSYNISILTSEGRGVWNTEAPAPEGVNVGALTVRLPTDIFEEDLYILALKGRAGGREPVEIDEYAFRVKR